VLVEVEAQQAGQQLAGGRPPDEVCQDAPEEEGRQQAAQGPCDLRRRLLGLVLPGQDRGRTGWGQGE
jgi:hypothetical protein